MMLKSLSRQVLRFLRWWRHLTLLALWPLDYISRLINAKTDFPPLHLRRYVGPLRSFESSGAEFLSYLRLLAELRPSDRILDIGCGCGLMALFLEDYLDENGAYVGVDIHRPSIRWCQKEISYRRSNFQFAHIDVSNSTYNPKGKQRADVYEFQYSDGAFDVILLKSVFTHMRPSEVSNYLGQVSRLLTAKGRCLATFFMLNEEQARLAKNGRNALAFNYGEGEWRHLYEHSPESAIAYDESYVMQLLAEHGLALKDRIYYGRWSGRTGGLSFPDILLLEKQ